MSLKLKPKNLLDCMDDMIRSVIISHLQDIQGGHNGPPTLEDLNRCGALHAFLEAGGTIEAVMTQLADQNPVKSKETGLPAKIEDDPDFLAAYEEARHDYYDGTGNDFDMFKGGVEWLLRYAQERTKPKEIPRFYGYCNRCGSRTEAVITPREVACKWGGCNGTVQAIINTNSSTIKGPQCQA